MPTVIHHTEDIVTLIDNGRNRYGNSDTVTAHPETDGVTVSFSRTFGSSHCLFLRLYSMQDVIDLADGETEESLTALIEKLGGCSSRCECDQCQRNDCDCPSCSES